MPATSGPMNTRPTSSMTFSGSTRTPPEPAARTAISATVLP